MREFTINASQLPAAWQNEIKRNLRATISGLRETAQEARTIVARQGPVDNGIFAGAWDVVNIANGAELRNDTPYAGIIEEGSRPHMPPRGPIREWVIRKIKDIGEYRQSIGEEAPLVNRKGKPRKVRMEDGKPVDGDERVINALTFLVCRKIANEGTKPHNILKDNQPIFLAMMAENVKKHLRIGG